MKMPEATPAPNTAQAAKDKVLEEVNHIVTSMLPDVAESVKTQLKSSFKGLFDSYVEALKKTGKGTASEIAKAGVEALAKLKTELAEANAEIAKQEKTVPKALADALTDWAKAMNANPKLIDALLLLPTLGDQIEKAVKLTKEVKENKQNIVVSAPKLIESYVALIITVVMLVVLLMQVFGK